MQRLVGNRLAPVFGRAVVARLTVLGRTTGTPRTTPIVVLEHDGERYLVAAYGDTTWSRNLRAAGQGSIRHRGRTEEFTAVEVPTEQRPPLLAAYVQKYGKAPGVRTSFERYPDPADHPVFRLTPR